MSQCKQRFVVVVALTLVSLSDTSSIPLSQQSESGGVKSCFTRPISPFVSISLRVIVPAYISPSKANEEREVSLCRRASYVEREIRGITPPPGGEMLLASPFCGKVEFSPVY